MDYFPIFVNLNERPVLVVGGGTVATRKVTLLLKAKAKINIVATNLCDDLFHLHEKNKINWIAKEFEANQMESAFLVISATDDKALNHFIFELAEKQKKWANVVDDQAHCNFIFPAIIDRNPIQIAISSAGKAPVLVRLLREKLEALLPQYIAIMASLSGKWRQKVKEKLYNITERRRFWERQFSGRFAQLLKNNQIEQAERELADQLDKKYSGGFVSLVGAGPGDSGLLTLKGLQEIQQADVVLYDALVSDQILELIRRDADRIFVGKRANQHSINQHTTNQLLVKLAKQGKRVVRLKGGDPFVFGRGGEELETLVENAIPFSVIPGITAGLGATAYAGIPLTHRDYAQSVIFITGHYKQDVSITEWKYLAQSNQTLVIYMGTIKVAEIAAHLQQFGRLPSTPIAIISQGTLATQKTTIGTLEKLEQLAKDVKKPALIVIGEVVKLQSKLAWFGEGKDNNAFSSFALNELNNTSEVK